MTAGKGKTAPGIIPENAQPSKRNRTGIPALPHRPLLMDRGTPESGNRRRHGLSGSCAGVLPNDMMRCETGGGAGIRTLGGVAPTTVFETVPFNRSGTPPFFWSRGNCSDQGSKAAAFGHGAARTGLPSAGPLRVTNQITRICRRRQADPIRRRLFAAHLQPAHACRRCFLLLRAYPV